LCACPQAIQASLALVATLFWEAAVDDEAVTLLSQPVVQWVIPALSP
jgi:hypothetical protein